MRTAIAALIFILSALLTAPVKAGPTPICEDRSGHMLRCGAVNAMPFGWHAPQAVRDIIPADKKSEWNAVIFLTLLFALIALLPDFDQKEWDKGDNKDQRGDRDKRPKL